MIKVNKIPQFLICLMIVVSWLDVRYSRMPDIHFITDNIIVVHLSAGEHDGEIVLAGDE